MLPGLDDGSPDLATSLAMAEMAVADGIVTTACTPHILPGVYANNTKSIASAVAALADALAKAAIPLELTIGADVHVSPSIAGHVHAGRVPTLAGSRYLPSSHRTMCCHLASKSSRSGSLRPESCRS
jgi:protein-tyrosine phosphatase